MRYSDIYFPRYNENYIYAGANYLYDEAFFFKWTVMDEVIVPMDIEPGDYALSFRWDCEQTPQIWNACSSIRII